MRHALYALICYLQGNFSCSVLKQSTLRNTGVLSVRLVHYTITPAVCYNVTQKAHTWGSKTAQNCTLSSPNQCNQKVFRED
jgi:hypothetical protein